MTKFSIPVPSPIASISGFDRKLQNPIDVRVISLPDAPTQNPLAAGNPDRQGTLENSGKSAGELPATFNANAATGRATPAGHDPSGLAAPVKEPDLTPLIEQVQYQVQELENNRRRSLRELQQLAVKLSVAIARQVCLREIAHDDHRVESLIESAVQQLGSAGPLQVHVHPKTHDHLLHGVASRWDSNLIQLIANPKMALGDVQVHSPDHLLEARFEDQLQQIEQQLLETIANAEIERRQTGTDGPNLQRFPDRRQS
jgi:hypothetical protein